MTDFLSLGSSLAYSERLSFADQGSAGGSALESRIAEAIEENYQTVYSDLSLDIVAETTSVDNRSRSQDQDYDRVHCSESSDDEDVKCFEGRCSSAGARPQTCGKAYEFQFSCFL